MNVVNAHTPARDQDAGDAGRDLQPLRSAGRPSRQQDALVQRREASCLRGLVWRLAASVAALSPAMAQAPLVTHDVAGATSTAVGVLFSEGFDDDPSGRSGLAAVAAAARLELGRRSAGPLLASGAKVGADYAIIFGVFTADEPERAAAFAEAVCSADSSLDEDLLELAIARAALAADDAEFLYPGDVLLTRARQRLAAGTPGARPPLGRAAECSELRPRMVRQHLAAPPVHRVALLGVVSAEWRAAFQAQSRPTGVCPPRGDAVYLALDGQPSVTQDVSDRADSPYLAAAFAAPAVAQRAGFALGMEVAKARAFRGMKLRGRELFARAPFVRWSWLEADPIVMFFRRGEDQVQLLPGQRRRASVADEVAATRRELEGLLEELRERPPSAAELAAARSMLLASVALPQPGERAEWATEPATYPGRLQAMMLATHHRVDAAALAAATAEDVAAALRETLAASRASWHVVAPRERARFGFRRR